MQAPVDFAEITAETPTIETVTAEYQAIQTQLTQAQTSEQRKAALAQWDALRRDSVRGENSPNCTFTKILQTQIIKLPWTIAINFRRL